MSSDMEPTTTRCDLPGVMTTAAALGVGSPLPGPLQAGLEVLHRRFDDLPVRLVRSREGRQLSAFRYANAHRFFPDAAKPLHDTSEFFYRAGITAQLGLSAHLLDVGFPDLWCARHISLRIANALAYANATGFDHQCPSMLRLARVLNPYWKWNPDRLRARRKPGTWGFEPDEVRALLGAMLRQVRHVTGHMPDSMMLRREGGDE